MSEYLNANLMQSFIGQDALLTMQLSSVDDDSFVLIKMFIQVFLDSILMKDNICVANILIIDD